MKTPDYMSYNRYKNKKKNLSQKGVLIFITTFFVTLLLFTFVAKSLSPDVDVTIGDDSSTDAKETGLGVKRFIDDRLKMIQMEDNSTGMSKKIDDKKPTEYNDKSFDNFSETLDEEVKIPTKNDENVIEEEPIEQTVSSSKVAAPRPKAKDLSTPFEAPKMSKVFVGQYSNLEQAMVAQGILLDSGLDLTPFIKDLGGSYTLQVGSYSSRAKAVSLATLLNKNNFPARVVAE